MDGNYSLAVPRRSWDSSSRSAVENNVSKGSLSARSSLPNSSWSRFDIKALNSPRTIGIVKSRSINALALLDTKDSKNVTSSSDRKFTMNKRLVFVIFYLVRILSICRQIVQEVLRYITLIIP